VAPSKFHGGVTQDSQVLCDPATAEDGPRAVSREVGRTARKQSFVTR